MHFLGLPARLSAPPSSQHSPGERCYNGHVGQFYMKHLSPSRPVAVKSPFMPSPTSGALSSLLVSGSEGRKALGETKDCSQAIESEGEGTYSCGSSCISSLFFSSKCLQSQGPRVGQVVGGLRGK